MIKDRYSEYFGEPCADVFSAAGRTEIGGNHTDHQNGRVLAAAVELSIDAAVCPLEDKKIEMYSEGYGKLDMDITDLDVREDEKGTTAGLIRGVLAGLADQGFDTGGFRAYVCSQVPAGSGLSSSAAFEILIGKIQSGLYNNDSISPVELARVGQYAENVYFGKPCGLMDQIACAVEGIVYIDFAYDGCPIIEEIEFDFEKNGYILCITHTGGSHADLTDEYAAVPDEMGKVARMFSQEKLRGITIEQLIDKAGDIRREAGDRALLRAMHFVNEDDRARKEAEALKEGDMEDFLKLVRESGDSSYKLLQNIYVAGDSVCQNIAVGLAVSEEVLGEKGVCRVHGGGFAGTIQSFVRKEAVPTYKKAMDKLFGEDACRVLNVQSAGNRRE